MNSYHEFGYVPAAEISKGRIVNEAGSVEVDGEEVDTGVKFLYINSTNEGEATNTVFDEIIVSAADGSELPELARGKVNIADEGTLVIKTEVIEKESIKEEDFIWLFKSGVKEQIVVTKKTPEQVNNAIAEEKEITVGESTVTIYQLKEGLEMLGKDNTVSNANEKAAAEIANLGRKASGALVGTTDTNGNEISEGDYLDENDNVVARADGSDVINEEKGTIQDSKTIATEEKASKENIIVGQTRFSGGSGTENDPYLVSNANEWYNLCTFAAGSYGEQYYRPETPASCYSATYGYFKITADIDYSGWALPADCELKDLHIDGNGKTISNIVSGGNVFANQVENYNAQYGYYPVEIKDFTFKNCEYVCLLTYYYVGTETDVNLTNVTIDNCDFNYGLCETIETNGEFNLNNFNIVNCDCPKSDAIFDYIYCGTLNIADSSIKNSTFADVLLYTYPNTWLHDGVYGDAFSHYANFNATNFDLIDSEFTSNGSYVYCAAVNSKLKFEDCDCVNVVVGYDSSESMGVGGFYGQAVYATDDATMDFDNCTFLGTIVSSKNNAAGFTAGNDGKITFTNCEVKAGTIIKNTSNGGAVTAFSGRSATYNGENKFNGTLLCNNKTKANTNSLAEKDNVWKEYKAITDPSAIFEIKEDGTIIYKGTDSYGKIEVTQTIAGQMYSADVQSVGGGFNWPFEQPCIFTNIVSGQSIGKITKFTNIVNIVDKDNPHNLAYASEDVDTYVTNCDSDSFGGRYLKKGTVAVCKSLTDMNGNYFFFAGTQGVDSVASITVKVEFRLFNAYGQFEDSCTLSYTFTPSPIN